MRVLLVQTLAWGGIAQYAYQLARALAGSRCQVILLAPPDYELASRMPARISALRFLPRLIPCASLARRLSAKPLRWFVIGLSSIIDAHRLLNISFTLKPAVIHIQGGHPMDIVYLLAARLVRVPVIYTAHNVLPHRPAPHHRLVHRLLYSLPDHIICHTQDARAQLLTLFRLQPRRVGVIPMPLFDLFDPGDRPSPDAARAALGLKPDQKVVLFFGQIRPNKGLPALLRAVAQVRQSQPDAVLLIAGEPLGDLRPALSMINHLGLRSAVWLRPGYVPLEQVPTYFQAADVVALPYARTTQSAVLALALAFDKAVVASRVGGLPELAQYSDLACLVPPDDEKALAQAILSRLDNPPRPPVQWHGLRWPVAARLTAALYCEALAARPQN